MKLEQYILFTEPGKLADKVRRAIHNAIAAKKTVTLKKEYRKEIVALGDVYDRADIPDGKRVQTTHIIGTRYDGRDTYILTANSIYQLGQTNRYEQAAYEGDIMRTSVDDYRGYFEAIN